MREGRSFSDALRATTYLTTPTNQDAQEHAEAEHDSKGLIRMRADRAIRGLNAFGGLFLQLVAGFADGLKGSFQTQTSFAGFFVKLASSCFNQFLRIVRGRLATGVPLVSA